MVSSLLCELVPDEVCMARAFSKIEPTDHPDLGHKRDLRVIDAAAFMEAYMDQRRIQRDIAELNRGPLGHLCAFCRLMLPCFQSRKEEEKGRMIL